MEDNRDEHKELRETILILLKTTEELKSVVAPLGQGQEHVLQVLKEHGEAILSLMDKLIGTQKEHKETLKSLELMRTHISNLEENIEGNKNLMAILEKHLKRLEFKQLSQVLGKINKEEPISDEDIELVEEILSSHPESETLLSIKAKVLSRRGRNKEAIELLSEAISRHPESARLWYEKGLLLTDFDERLECYDKSLDLLKNEQSIPRHLVFYSRAALFANAQRFEEAFESSSKSVEMNPECPVGWVQKGMILNDLNRNPEALGCFAKALELDENSKEAWFEKGVALAALGPNYETEALECFDEAIRLDSKWGIAYFNKGKMLILKDQYDKALQAFDEGLKYDDKDACGWCDRGVTLNRLGRNQEALESFRKALELDPPKDCCMIFADMAIVFHALGNYEEGVKFARKAVEVDPNDARWLSILASNLLALQKDGEALEVFEKALKMRKSDEEIYWDDLAELYQRIGRDKDAEEARKKFELSEKAEKA